MGDNGAAAGGADAADDIDVGDGGRVMSSHAAKMSPGVFFCALVYAIVVLKRKAKKIIRRRREKRSRVKSKLKDTIAQSNRQVAEASFGRQIIRPSSAQLLQRRSDQESPAVFNGSTGLWPNRPDTASRATAAAAGVASTTYGAPSITSPSRATIIDHKALSQTKSRAKQIVDRIKLMSPSDALGKIHLLERIQHICAPGSHKLTLLHPQAYRGAGRRYQRRTTTSSAWCWRRTAACTSPGGTTTGSRGRAPSPETAT